MNVPMNAATMPTTMVSQNGMSCLPGANEAAQHTEDRRR